MRPIVSADEPARLDTLSEFEILNSEPDALFDDVARLAATIADCPIGWISLIDRDQEWLKAAYGTDVTQILRLHAPGFKTIEKDELSLQRYPALGAVKVSNDPIAFYAGVPIIVRGQMPIGTIAALHTMPHSLSASQSKALIQLADHVAQLLELRLRLHKMTSELEHRLEIEKKLTEFVGRLQDAHIDLQMHGAELSVANAKLQDLAETDGLTGLRNHRFLFDEMTRRFNAREQMALVIVDLDAFKAFNDVHGHVAGDETLREVAKILESAVRENDIAARYGGEEFALLLWGANNKTALEVAERLRYLVETHPWPLRTITMCAGIAERTDNLLSVEDLVRRADAALYAAKRSGKNRVLAWSAPSA